MISNAREKERLFSRLDEASAAREDYRERFDFCKDTLQYLMERRESSSTGIVPLNPSEVKVRLQEGFPLMDRVKLIPDLREAAETFDGLLGLVGERTALPEEVIDQARRWRRSESFADTLLAYFRDGDLDKGMAARLGVEERELMVFLFQGSLKPFHENHALANAGKDLSPWEMGYCPLCGGLPAIGELRGEEGHRYLLCHRCGSVWNFPRVKCPVCGNREHEKLRYLSFDAEPAYRVDVCESCRGYLKQVDSRSFPGDVILEAEDLVTPHLDLIAVREGYVKKNPNILGLFR